MPTAAPPSAQELVLPSVEGHERRAADPTLPRVLTAAEVADQTGLSLQRVYELTRSGDLPSVRLGRACRYSAPRVSAWLEDGGTGSYTGPTA